MRLVLVGRDGVINKTGTILSPNDWHPIPGSLAALSRLSRGGWQIAVFSHQPELVHGKLELNTLYAIHDKMRYELAKTNGQIDGVFFCPHETSTACNCSIEDGSLYRQIASSFDVDLENLPIVCAVSAQLKAAHCVKARAIGVGNREDLLHHGELHQDLATVVDSLMVN